MKYLTNKWLLWLTVALIVTMIIPLDSVSGQAFQTASVEHPDEPFSYVPRTDSKRPTDVIVELKTEPTYSKQQIQREQQTFVAAAQSTGAMIKYRYNTFFNGYAMTVSADSVDDLLLLPGVQAVYPDRPVRQLAIESASMAGMTVADLARSTGVAHFWELGFKGKGITVGLIDTGVDYNHPNLRDAFHSSDKGYNFVRKDLGTDPRPRNMAEETHGTHVAGIIAGRGAQPGGVIGVAPEASLRAYRVLDSDGIGQESSAIAAIERAVADGVDIINLSLGVETKDNELTPLAKVVNNAVQSGVVVVAANGNDGPKPFTANTPAAAELAIAVGASDGRSSVADFSSRGPSTPNLRIKPDIAAPGLGIRSTTPGNTYGVQSGTSMASPFVAGACALLLQKYGSVYDKSERPIQVKAHLMNNASRLNGFLLTEQGAGLINLFNVKNAQSIAMTDRSGSISFGRVAPGSSVTRTIRIQDIDRNHQQYDIRTHITGSVQLTVNNGKSDVNVHANDVTSVNIVAYVPKNSPPGMYEGYISFTERTTRHTLHIPLIVFVPGADIDFPPGIVMKRIAGGNRYATSLALSRHVEDHRLDTVVLASGRDFPDALAGGTLVNALNGTVLLVDPLAQQLNNDLVQTIQRILNDKGNIILLGGTQAIPARVEQQLKQIFNDRFTVTRIAGSNRQETATKIAEYVTNRPDEIFLVNGNHFADAMSIVPYANQAQIPILLNRSANGLDAAVENYLNDKHVRSVTLIGGTQVIDESIVDELKRRGYTVERISGKNRFLTAFEVMKHYYPNTTQWAIANGLNFPDALSASRLAYDENMPILLSLPDQLSPEIEYYMYKHHINRLFLIGGPTALSDDLLGF